MNASTLRERIRYFIRLTKVCGENRGFVRESEREREKKSKTYRVTGVVENNKILDNRRDDKARPHSLCTKCEGEGDVRVMYQYQ